METKDKTADILTRHFSDEFLAPIMGRLVMAVEKCVANQTASLRKEIEEKDKEIERLKSLVDGRAAPTDAEIDRMAPCCPESERADIIARNWFISGAKWMRSRLSDHSQE